LPIDKYKVLLIVTDGVIHDLLPTIDMIGLSTHCPMSIVIIGVGQDDFALMNKLNSDFKVIFSFSYKKKGISRDPKDAETILSEEYSICGPTGFQEHGRVDKKGATGHSEPNADFLYLERGGYPIVPLKKICYEARSEVRLYDIGPGYSY
jgi:hypothetical protein